MRIGMISTPFVAVPPKTYGGTERVVYELVEGLAARGHDVTLFSTGDSRTSATLAFDLRRAHWPPDQFVDAHHVAWAVGQVASSNFDLVHAHSALALTLTRFMPDVPLVYTLHHERDERLSGLYALDHDAHFVAISRDQAEREIALPDVTVIHHGLNPRDFECTSRAAEYVCFIGRLSLIKGPQVAIEVAKEAGMPILVAGEIHDEDGPEGRTIIQPCLDLPHVTHFGNIDANAKSAMLSEARAFLAPIAWNEPFGLVFIEAMLSGCPVVAFGRGSVPELVEQGITGFVVETADEMRALVARGSPLDHFDRRRCRERAIERFSSARMVTDHERLYERILGARGRGTSRSPAMTLDAR